MADCNAFEHCKWLRHMGKVMVLVVMAFVGLSVWAVVVDTYGPCISGERDNSSPPLLCLLTTAVFLFLVGMLLWSYFVAVGTDPGRVPVGWTPFADEEEASDELERIASSRSASDRLAGSSRPRYCRKCKAWKPPRAHHDSVSGYCVLKMDHYCVWIINCVGLFNYKAFLLFLVYACLACTLASLSLLGSFVRFVMSGRGEETPFPDASDKQGSVSFAIMESYGFRGLQPIAVFVAFVVDAAFVLCLAGFVVMHARLVAANCTTIEMYEKRRVQNWPYDHGFKSNFHEVFGYRIIRWFVPFYSEEEKQELLDGLLSQRHGRFEEMKLTELAADF